MPAPTRWALLADDRPSEPGSVRLRDLAYGLGVTTCGARLGAWQAEHVDEHTTCMIA